MSLELNDVLFDVKTNKPVKIDLTEIIKSRALFQANSGGGKSYILRKFLEQSHGKVQQIIIDPEGEFGTLREKYDYLLVSKGEGANIQLNINHAALLARRLLETGANAILDLYELNPFERIAYVKAFCDALVNLPKSLWHSCLIVIDEIHTFAPENSKGNAGSLEAVAALASRGRKRGYALIGATQKLSKFHKDVAAELNTKFTGRCILDIDQKRAAAELGLQDYKSLRNLKYEFWAFGPAISGEPILVKSFQVETKHEDIGNTRITKIADQDKLTKMMEQFKDLPTEAANELKTKEDLQNKIKELTVRISQMQREQQSSGPNIDPQALQQAEQRGFEKGIKEAESKFTLFQSGLKRLYATHRPIYMRIADMAAELGKVEQIIPEIDHFLNTPLSLKLPTETKSPTLPIRYGAQTTVQTTAPQVITKSAESTNSLQIAYSNGELSGPERKILSALLVQSGRSASRAKIALLTNYSVKGGGYQNILGKLRSRGFVQYSGENLIATDEAAATVTDLEPIPTTHDEVLSMWKNKLGDSKGKILEAVCESYPSPITREDLAEKTGYSASGGGFQNNLGAMRTLGLIEYLPDRQVVATKEMFPDG